MATRDFIGKRGEAVVMGGLLDFCGNPNPYFDPHPLGEKCPTFDYLVELVGNWKSPPYFLVQVKATQRSSSPNVLQLPVSLKANDVQKMVHCPIPTYLIGVNEPNARAYIIGIHAPLKIKTISRISTKHPLNPENLKRLHDEVDAYWRTMDPALKTSSFTL
jgi:hypothetical protein